MRVEVDALSLQGLQIYVACESKRRYAAEMVVARTNWRREAKQKANCGSDMRSYLSIVDFCAASIRLEDLAGGGSFNGNLESHMYVRTYTLPLHRPTVHRPWPPVPLFARTLSACCAT